MEEIRFGSPKPSGGETESGRTSAMTAGQSEEEGAS